MKWLEKVFKRHTKPLNPHFKWLLIVNDHSSHVNIKFIDWADRYEIIILILSPHTTHKLQPLNVGLFQPLSTAYSQEQNKLMILLKRLVLMIKRFFYPMFLGHFELFSLKTIFNTRGSKQKYSPSTVQLYFHKSINSFKYHKSHSYILKLLLTQELFVNSSFSIAEALQVSNL